MRKFKGIDREGDFDQLQMNGNGWKNANLVSLEDTQLGQDAWGDFSQYSLHGVDYGANYETNYGIEPNILKGDHTMYGADYQQLGNSFGMGVIPEGLSGDFNQLGIIPEGLGGNYQQLGHGQYQQLGQGFMDQLNKPLATVGGINITPIGLLLVGGGIWFAQRQGMFKKLGF